MGLKRTMLLAVAAIVVASFPLSCKTMRPHSSGALELPCPRKGRVVDADTGRPIAGAVVQVEWQIYDYPMLDGGGSYTVSVEATSDANGVFVLPLPSHRRGFYNTERRPPYIKATGCRDFTYSDWSEINRREGDMMVYPLRRWERIRAGER
jgi:hypothetical protein